MRGRAVNVWYPAVANGAHYLFDAVRNASRDLVTQGRLDLVLGYGLEGRQNGVLNLTLYRHLDHPRRVLRQFIRDQLQDLLLPDKIGSLFVSPGIFHSLIWGETRCQ